MNYKDTLNLPKTDFSMKANLPQKEPRILQQWEEMDIYSRIRAKRAGRPLFVLHDGPPYANGNIHLGHVLNKILKDIIIKYKTMRGFDAPFVPGWDCHGLPIEYQLLKELGKSKHQIDRIEFRHRARKYAERYVGIQREEFKRLGIFGKWDEPYLTMANSYSAVIIRTFARLYEKGYIYRGLKPILWCPNCETALAEAEVEYNDHKSPSIFVKFKVKDGLPENLRLPEDVFVVIWTTTPWTLPANLAIAIRPEYTYSFVQPDGSKDVLVMVKQLVGNVMETIGSNGYKILWECKGEELKSVITQHPFIERESPVVFSEHVVLEHGTGCVHIAPGHGDEDFELGLRYGLDIYAPVDSKGCFTGDVKGFEGMNVFDANPEIIKLLREKDRLLYSSEIVHTYPHCWRCKEPIIFRATKQWFLGIDRMDLRNRLLNTVQEVNWVPVAGQRRIADMIISRPDWCLSRQRLWGVGIPVLFCTRCNRELCNPAIMDRIADIVEKEGSDAWFSRRVEELIPEGTICEGCGNGEFYKEEDIIDVWFDSGVSHIAVLMKRKDQAFPADIYLEGSDQHRGWFQTSLITSVCLNNRAPFKTVLTHGFVVDGEGRKMSKSVGNVISPQELLPEYGADILRMWAASIDYRGDVPLSEEILKQLADSYRKIRNTFRFMLGNLYDFDPEKHTLTYERLTELDRWALCRLYRTMEKVTKGYEEYRFYEVYHTLYNYCVVDLSSLYFDILKDRLYTFAKDSRQRRSAQTVISVILQVLVKVFAPIIPFTTEEVWNYLPAHIREEESVHTTFWPQLDSRVLDQNLEMVWDRLLLIREEVLKALEKVRRENLIGSSLEANIKFFLADTSLKSVLEVYKPLLPTLLIVSQVEIKDYIADSEEVKRATPSSCMLGLYILVEKAKGKKCVRCWNWSVTVGDNQKYPDICERCVNVLEGGENGKGEDEEE